MSKSLGVAPQGAPRGLLIYWILHRIAKSPTYGYEILTELEQKTEGAWRPGAGSIYPILKKLERKGLIEAEQTGTNRVDHRRYRITPAGIESVRKSKETFKLMSSKFSRMRGVFLDLLDPEELAEYVVEGTRRNFELVREVIETKGSKVSETDLEYMLKEYSLALERQQDWASGLLRARMPVPKSPSRRRSK